MAENQTPEESKEVSTDYQSMLEEAQAETPQQPEGRVPRTREEIRRSIFKLRGQNPTEEQLDYMEKAEQNGTLLN